MENGRLLRLLAKLCFTKDRSALGDDAEWGEHSDRYLMRLFADSLFQQVEKIIVIDNDTIDYDSVC